MARTVAILLIGLAVAGCDATGTHRRPVATATCVHDGQLGTQGSLGGVPVPSLLNPTLFHLTNLWLAKRNGKYIAAYAGAQAATPTRGTMLVMWTDPRIGLPEDRSGFFTTGRPTGPITLTGVCGERLSFRYRGGNGTFDLSTRRFQLQPSAGAA